jgi:hypothetical protein
MGDAIKELLASRKVWIGGATIVVVALLKLVLPKLGLEDTEQIQEVANSVIEISLVLIAALAAQNVVAIIKGTTNGDPK